MASHITRTSLPYQSQGDVLDAPVGKYDLNYNMDHPKRGRALIFNHFEYDDNLELEARHGTKEDCENLKNTLVALNFEVSIHEDLSYKEIKDVLDKVSAEDHSQADCLFVAVMTHGWGEGFVYGKDKPYRVDKMWENFTIKKCPTLAAKPKIFLIQACRGTNKSNAGVPMTKVQTDGAGKDSLMFKTPNHSDFVIMFSTIPSYVSWRDLDKGSWLVQSFCRVLDEEKYYDDFLSLLTKTSHEIVTTFDKMEFMQTACVTSMLTRKIKFKPK